MRLLVRLLASAALIQALGTASALAQQTVLTTITQLDPAYVNFSTSESEFVELRDINRAREKPPTEADSTATRQPPLMPMRSTRRAARWAIFSDTPSASASLAKSWPQAKASRPCCR